MAARRRPAARGLTLVEVLIAGLISSIVLISIYFVFVSNSANFYRQEQAIQVQERLRFAMEYLKNDMRNVGRLTVVNGGLPSLDQVQGVLPFRALELFEEDPNVPVLFDNGNELRPDRLRLLLDASGAVPLGVSQVMGQEIQVAEQLRQPTEAARAMVSPDAEATFNLLFARGNLAHIRSAQSGRYAMGVIESAQFNGGIPEIRVSGLLNMDVHCPAGACQVNPVHLVEYAVVADEQDPQRTQLVRRRLNAASPNDPPLDSVVVAEYVVNLQMWATYDARGPGEPFPVFPADPNPADTEGNWPGLGRESSRMNLDVHRVRALHVLLAVRTPREDEDFRARVVPEIPADLTWFEVAPGLETGLARVSTLVSTVETPNLNRGL